MNTINTLQAIIATNDVALRLNNIRVQWSFRLRLLLQNAYDCATNTSSLDDDNDNLPNIDANAEYTPVIYSYMIDRLTIITT